MRVVRDGQFNPMALQVPEGFTGRVETVRVIKPWGREEWIVFGQGFALKTLVINRGARFSLQRHDEKEEAWVVLNGPVQVFVGPSPEELTEMTLYKDDVFILAPGTVHRVHARDGVAILLEVSTPQLADVVRFEDDFGRI
ncbi:MAG: cupin [Patescibacteria group bacterium]|jgi:mannose-6-phosphate isomerase-like protein (cupin superfamily)